MSGHSHYSTIKRTKEAKDSARGKVFSKLTRAIQIAIKTGGSNDPDSNYKLRMAIDAAKSENMPKSNIEKVIQKAAKDAQSLEEVTYEGYGPEGIAVIVEAATDNRNRTAQEIKGAFERGGGTLAGPGAVSFNFNKMGQIVVKKDTKSDEQMLKLIDMGVEEVEETVNELEIFVPVNKMSLLVDNIENAGNKVISKNLTMRTKTPHTIEDPQQAERIIKFLEKLESLDDVQDVYTNLDIPDEVIEKLDI